MSVGSGLGSSVGTGIEVTYGTEPAITQWLPDASCEIKLNPHFEQGEGLRAGKTIHDISDHSLTSASPSGTIKTPVYDTAQGRWIGALFGTLTSGAPVNSGGATYKQNHVWGPQYGNSLAIQEGIPLRDGSAVKRWDTTGVVVSEGAFSLDGSALLQAVYSIEAQDRQLSASTITAPNPTAVNPFAWHQATVKIGTYGAETSVSGIAKAAWSYKRKLKTDSLWVGTVSTSPLAYAVRGQPVDNGFAEITGTLDTEYLSEATFVDLFLNQTKQSLIITFIGPQIGATPVHYSMTFNFPCVIFEGADPTVTGPDVVQPQMMFKADLDSVAGTPAPSIVIESSESTL